MLDATRTVRLGAVGLISRLSWKLLLLVEVLRLVNWIHVLIHLVLNANVGVVYLGHCRGSPVVLELYVIIRVVPGSLWWINVHRLEVVGIVLQVPCWGRTWVYLLNALHELHILLSVRV